MKLTTLLLIVLWPTAILFWTLAIASCYGAAVASRNKLFELQNQLSAMTRGVVVYYPWRSRLAYAVATSLVLAWLHGWLTIA
jgi:hypothetical protein